MQGSTPEAKQTVQAMDIILDPQGESQYVQHILITMMTIRNI